MPTQTVRCVGGPSDGRRVEFPGGVEEMPIIDPIHIPDPQPGKITQSFPATLYMLREMRTPDGEIRFATPVSWSMGQALRHALT